MQKRNKISPVFKVVAATVVGAAALAGHAVHAAQSSPSTITADRDGQGRVICNTWDTGRLRHDGDPYGPTFGYGLINLDCVHPGYPTGSPRW